VKNEGHRLGCVKYLIRPYDGRPRPPSLLTQVQLTDIEKRFKEFQKKYNKQDKVKDAVRIAELESEKNAIKSAFRQLVGQRKREWEADAEWRKSQGIQPETDADFVLVEETLEDVLEETEVPV